MAICNDIGLCTLWTHERLHASSKQALYPDDAMRVNCTANRCMLLARGAAASRGALLKVRPFLPTVPPRRCGKRVPAPHRREETAREKTPEHATWSQEPDQEIDTARTPSPSTGCSRTWALAQPSIPMLPPSSGTSRSGASSGERTQRLPDLPSRRARCRSGCLLSARGEVREESGCEVEVSGLLSANSNLGSLERGVPEMVVLAFTCEPVGGEPRGLW